MTEVHNCIAHFSYGDRVPSWLIDQEPLSPNAHAGELTFVCEVDILETPDYYAVLPLAPGNWPGSLMGAIDCSRSREVNFRATAKPVYSVLAHARMGGADLPLPRSKTVLEERPVKQATASLRDVRDRLIKLNKDMKPETFVERLNAAWIILMRRA